MDNPFYYTIFKEKNKQFIVKNFVKLKDKFKVMNNHKIKLFDLIKLFIKLSTIYPHKNLNFKPFININCL